MNDSWHRNKIHRGAAVAVVLKEDQRTGRLTYGLVADILTPKQVHPRGIKVRLTDGQVGRVQHIIPPKLESKPPFVVIPVGVTELFHVALYRSADQRWLTTLLPGNANWGASKVLLGIMGTELTSMFSAEILEVRELGKASFEWGSTAATVAFGFASAASFEKAGNIGLSFTWLSEQELFASAVRLCPLSATLYELLKEEDLLANGTV